MLQPLTGVDLASIVPYYWFAYGEVANARAPISRTGYTGEDGFEIFVPPNMADRVWQALLESGRGGRRRARAASARATRCGSKPAMRLYGNDIDDTTTPLEAGLGWMVGWNKPSFIGRDRLRQQKAEGPTRQLVGFEMIDRGIARHGYPVVRAARRSGTVTSGTQTPFLKKAIGMAYVPADLAAPGTAIDIDIRGRVDAGRGGAAAVLQTPIRRAGA